MKQKSFRWPECPGLNVLVGKIVRKNDEIIAKKRFDKDGKKFDNENYCMDEKGEIEIADLSVRVKLMYIELAARRHGRSSWVSNDFFQSVEVEEVHGDATGK